MDRVAEKKTYYVSVLARTILEGKGDAAYEFEIVASEEEIEQLKELFDGLESSEQQTYFQAHYLGYPYHQDTANDVYDRDLKAIYRMLRELGTPETRSHIDTIADKLS